MVKPEFDYERCLVCVRSGGKVAGTGFVIGPGTVLTCAHVVAGKSNEPEPKEGKPLEIEFYTSESSGVPRPVTIDSRYFSPQSRSDIAVLTFDGDLPAGVKRARLSQETKLVERNVWTRGFAKLDEYECITGVGKILGLSNHEGGASVWQLNSKEITEAFSGAPLVDKSTEFVVGMVRGITKPDGDWRHTESAFAITCEAIRAVCRELLAPIENHVEDKQKEAVDQLKGELAKGLAKSRVVLGELVAVLKIEKSGSLSSDADRVADKLTDQGLSVDELVKVLLPLYRRFNERRNAPAAKVVLDAYLTVLSAILEPELVTNLRAIASEGIRTLVIPTSAKTVVGIMMAGLDGRPGKFREPEKPGGHPISEREIPLPPDRGYSHSGSSTPCDDSVVQALCDGLGIDLSDVPQEKRSSELGEVFAASELGDERLYVVSDHAKPVDSSLWRHLREQYPYLYLVQMNEPTKAADSRHTRAMALARLCFARPTNAPKRRSR